MRQEEARGQPAQVVSPHLPFGLWRLDTGHQVWWQAESSLQPRIHFLSMIFFFDTGSRVLALNSCSLASASRVLRCAQLLQAFIKTVLLHLFMYLLCVCVCVCVCVSMHAGQRTTCGSHFSSSIMCIRGLYLSRQTWQQAP